MKNPDNKDKHRPDKKAGYLKMKVISDLKTTTINDKIEECVAEKTTVKTDESSSYNKTSPTINHIGQKVDKKDVNSLLPWVHKTISNSKRLLLDIHHRIDADFLQNYLNEFCYKFNRGYFTNPMERLIVAGVNNRWNQL